MGVVRGTISSYSDVSTGSSTPNETEEEE